MSARSSAKGASRELSAGEIRAEIDEELQFHIDRVAAELVRSGLSLDEALLEARRRFGDIHTITRACTHQRLRTRTMLQRFNTVLIALLVAAVATLMFRSEAEAAESRDQLREMQSVMANLGEQNGELIELVRLKGWSGAAPQRVNTASSQKQTLPKLAMPDGSAPASKVEEAFAAWIADRPWASRKLAAFGDDAVPYVTDVLNGTVVVAGPKQHMMRFVAANVLGDTGSPSAVTPLLAALDDEFMNVRRCAALALGKIGDKQAIPALEELAANDPYVYRGAKSEEPQALVRIDAKKALAMFDAAAVK